MFEKKQKPATAKNILTGKQIAESIKPAEPNPQKVAK